MTVRLSLLALLTAGALAGCTTTTDGTATSTTIAGVTVTSTPVTVGTLVVTPKTARKGETLKFSFRVDIASGSGARARWSFDIANKVEGTGTVSSSTTVTHEESASSLISTYGTGTKTAHLRVYDYYADNTYSSQDVTFTLQ